MRIKLRSKLNAQRNKPRSGLLDPQKLVLIEAPRSYSLRVDSPILGELRNIFLKTSGAGMELRSALEKIPGVEVAFLYGSYASGEAHAASEKGKALLT